MALVEWAETKVMQEKINGALAHTLDYFKEEFAGIIYNQILGLCTCNRKDRCEFCLCAEIVRTATFGRIPKEAEEKNGD